MINILSRQVDAKVRRGPFKVLINLTKGLESIGYPYVLNRALSATRRVWVHDDANAYRCLRNGRHFAIVGPNLYSRPEAIMHAPGPHSCFTVPSCWLYNIWLKQDFDPGRLCIWPVGIDTEAFHPGLLAKQRNYILIYFKKRDLEGLSKICNVLSEQHLPYKICIYDYYDEEVFKTMLSGARFVVWYGCHETQGIGLLETLACDVPVLLIDDYRGDERTAAPYFDECCGMIIDTLEDFQAALTVMLDNYVEYRPRQYVVTEMGLARQARAFVELWDRWGLSLEGGKSEPCRSDRPWAIPMSLHAQELMLRVRARFGFGTES